MSYTKTVNGIEVPCTAEDEALISEKEALWVEKQKTAYIGEQQSLYPNLILLIEILYNSMKNGEIASSKEFVSAIDAAKLAYPEPKSTETNL